jgi:predicted nucleic acid-binding protein
MTGLSLAILHAEIVRKLRQNGITLKNSADCLIASCAQKNNAAVMENDADYQKIAMLVPLDLV